jgi:hypothetical protein
VFGSFASARRDELERIREEGNGFYAWGAIRGVRNIPNWLAMARGDYVLCVLRQHLPLRDPRLSQV